jgi:predicted amidophosphoribosyltransferase
MFCPRCGKSDQLPESFCRQCGLHLTDLSKPAKREHPPEEHLKANTVLSILTIVTCFTLATLLYTILGFRSFTHPLIYVTASLLLGMGGWHIQTLIRTLKLKGQWKQRTRLSDELSSAAQTSFNPASTGKLLNATELIPASVTEQTTRHLVERR